MPSRDSLALLPRTRRGLVLFWTALFMLSIALQYASAAAPGSAVLAADATKVSICHATSSETNPYTNPNVNISSSGHLQGGHDTEHLGPIWYPEAKSDGVVWGDIIPPYDYGDFHYPGHNWTAEGQAILEGGCNPNATPEGADIAVDKSADPTSLPAGGGEVTYTYVVTNEGDIALTDVSVSDNKCAPVTFVDGDANDDDDLDLNETWTFTCTTTLTVTTTNTGTAYGTPEEYDDPISATDTATVTVAKSEPGVSIVKSVSLTGTGGWENELTVTTGTTVYYRITITNTGNVPLTDVSVADNEFNLEECDVPSTLAVDAHYDCDYSAVAETGKLVNTATVSTEETQSAKDDATVNASENPVLSVQKSNNAPEDAQDLPTAKEGDTVTFTLSYSITGAPASDGVIVDFLPKGLTYVEGSATDSANGEFVFAEYDADEHALVWLAEGVTEGGSVTYQATVGEGAAELEQPLENTACIASAVTDEDDWDDCDDSDVYVAAPPQAETSVPTPPQTDAIGSTTSEPAGSLLLVLLALAGIALAVVFVAPTPASLRKRMDR